MAETVGVFEVEAILNKRTKYFKQNGLNSKRVEYLVQWKGFRKGEETWEPLANLSTALSLIREYNRVGKPVTVVELMKRNNSSPSTVLKATKQVKRENSPAKSGKQDSPSKKSPKTKRYDPAEFSTFVPAVPGTKRKSTSIYALMREDGSPLKDTTAEDNQTSANDKVLVNGEAAPAANTVPKRCRSVTAIKTKGGLSKPKAVSKNQERARKVVSTILAKKKVVKGASSQKNVSKSKAKGSATKGGSSNGTSKKTSQSSVQNSKAAKPQECVKGSTGVKANTFYGKSSAYKSSTPNTKSSSAATPKTNILKSTAPKAAAKGSTTKQAINNKGKKSASTSDASNTKGSSANKNIKTEAGGKGKKSASGKTQSAIKKRLVIKVTNGTKNKAKNAAAKKTSESKNSAKPAASKKRKAEEMDFDSDSDDILYSLADDEQSSSGDDASSSESGQAARKKMKLSLTPIDEKKDLTKMTCVVTSPGIPICAKSGKLSPVKKMLLKDSMKSKSKSAMRSPAKLLRPDTAAPLAPKSPPHAMGGATPFKTPPSTPSGAGNSSREVTPSKGGYNHRAPSVPVLPSSPIAPSFDTIMKNLSYKFNGSRASKRKGSDNEDEVAERRVSVRQSENAFKYKEILVKKSPGFTQIWLMSQTQRKNALNPKVFRELQEALHNARFDDSRLVMLTGSGTVFCSGVDLHYLQNGDRRNQAKEMADSIREFIGALILFPKPVVAVVNGPAVGLGVSILPLCDIVYASDKATFHCPWSLLAQTPEGCATHTFPNVIGMAMANEIILAGRRITAIEACQGGLVSQVFWPTSMLQEVMPRLRNMAQHSGKAMEASKLLIRNHQNAKLEAINGTETQMLAERWSSGECHRAIKAYLDSEQEL